jgi:2-dehydro-3-deoxyphosphogluconate aldolase/(4S)-4-hydroxy-2-oxoglutarate aldolase
MLGFATTRPHNVAAMTKPEIIRRLLDPGVIAIIRMDSSEQLMRVAKALQAGGITALEVTMTTPNALRMITELCGHFGDKLLVGVGTVLDGEIALAAILAGAEFVVTPVTKLDVIRLCGRYAKPIASGAFTPTEALAAHEAGADFIKIFPADQLGPTYIRSLLAPLPMLQIIPTGGVTTKNARAYIEAGCVALGAGSTLISREVVKRGEWRKLTTTAAAFVRAVRRARS